MKGEGYVSLSEIPIHHEWIKKYKVFISRAYGERGEFPYLVIGKPFVGKPDSCCTETYLSIGPFENASSAENAISYMQTRFFRFLVLLTKKYTRCSSTSLPVINIITALFDKFLDGLFGGIKKSS